MPDSPSILKTPSLDYSQDYNFLRTQGLKYIEELGSKFWTDYNEHDPGITILEALCYAITELGYRAGMPMQNLLADTDGKISSTQTFYTAGNILTQSPLTIDDYRKLVIDIEGIHNAWLFNDDFYTDGNTITPAGEIPIYADCKKDELTYKKTSQQVYLSGLYKVLIDLENDLQFGDLNNGEVVILTPAVNAVAPARSFKTGDASLTIAFPKWNDDALNADVLKCSTSTIDVTMLPVINEVIHTQGQTAIKDWTIEITFSCDVNATSNVSGHITVDVEPASGILTLTDIQSFFITAFTKQVVYLYALKIQKAKKSVQTAIRALNENRNLCEDFVNVTTVQDEEIAVCCDIDVKPSADIEDVQAKVFYAIEEYFNPTVKFYTLDELMSKGKTTDEIFEGPKLKHGFIDTDELDATQLRRELHTSDIINLLMDIDGVLAVRNFRMTKYDADGNTIPNRTGKAWCMPVSLWHKPVFSETKSKIIFYKKQITYLPSLSEVRDTLKWLRAAGMRNKLNGHALDIPLPDGTFVALDEYTSVEYLFPLTYGIGKAGLPPSATDERRAQAKQLKAYLMFYDQLLADFFGQLKNAKELFSTDAVKQTYYAQFLSNIKDIDAIYKKDGTNNDLLQLVLQNQDSTIAPPNATNDWEKLYESNETFLDRRNRFLDHLMARFAESFNDYVLLMYSLNFQTQQATKITPAELINDKINFLKDYPQLSYERDRAFDYLPQKDNFTINATRLWDTDNVSGLEKKLSRLGGIENFFRRFLYCTGNATIIATGDTPSKYSFIISNKNGDTLTSATYDDEAVMNKTLFTIVDFLLAETNVGVKESSGNWQILIIDNNGNILATSNNFSSEADADASLQQFITEADTNCNDDGLHLIEHILLRPRVPVNSNNPFVLAPVCLDKNCDFCGEEDPYSFRMTIVLPYWTAHLRSLAFREYFEDIVRREAPAHTAVKVCWLSDSLMYEFEAAYKNWIDALADYSPDKSIISAQTNFQQANDALLKLVFNLHSEYPLATLHDCNESKDVNPVVLGKTILGSFKN